MESRMFDFGMLFRHWWNFDLFGWESSCLVVVDSIQSLEEPNGGEAIAIPFLGTLGFLLNVLMTQLKLQKDFLSLRWFR
jgi:hypothetical protein